MSVAPDWSWLRLGEPRRIEPAWAGGTAHHERQREPQRCARLNALGSVVRLAGNCHVRGGRDSARPVCRRGPVGSVPLSAPSPRLVVVAPKI
jgi:hypothetical protein